MGKLFGKHKKASEQEFFLKNTPFICAVGTPARIEKLVEAGPKLFFSFLFPLLFFTCLWVWVWVWVYVCAVWVWVGVGVGVGYRLTEIEKLVEAGRTPFILFFSFHFT